MISIIIPVYNSEKYLQKCVSSILSQSMKDIEVLLINDGSKDSSPTICDNLAKQDARVRVHHKMNGGISSARNAGLNMALGEWVTFCDNDDLVSPEWLARMLALADEETLPLCAFTRTVEKLGDINTIDKIQTNEKYEAASYLEFYIHRLGGFVWNALYRREIIEKNHIRFPERKAHGDINEDLIFDFMYLPYIKKIVYTGYADYYWASNESNHSKATAHKFYFEKYEEKYRLWRNHISTYVPSEQKDHQLKELSTFHLYEMLQSIISAPSYKVLKARVLHPSMQDCIKHASFNKSDKIIVQLIKYKLSPLLWLLIKRKRLD